MENTSEPKKRKADSTKYKRKIIKKSRVEGTPYTNYRNKQIPLKVVRLPCSCKQKCFDKFTEEERLQIFNRFYSFQTKDEQYLFLQAVDFIHSKQKMSNTFSCRQYSSLQHKAAACSSGRK
ncbi:hypothetical protein QE152_g2006 [Popillia japonica]|uniref:Uncharacterized protein n=1 Tax=Popillia japonica TaxID=7064 RepID=A0AAW1N6W3_POPJA